MKIPPTVIDKCANCTFASLDEHGYLLACSKITSSQVMPRDLKTIPEWCPLEDAIEVVGRYNPLSGEGIKEAIEEARLEEEKKRAEWNLKVVQGIGPLFDKLDMLARKTCGTGDIITNYMRRERGRL